MPDDTDDAGDVQVDGVGLIGGVAEIAAQAFGAVARIFVR